MSLAETPPQPVAARPTVVVLGATSAIARATAGRLAARGYGLLLAGRDPEELGWIAADLRVRHAVPVESVPFEALGFETHEGFVRECADRSGGALAGVLLCFGYLGDQVRAEGDFSEARKILDTNFVAAVSVLDRFASVLERRGSGFLCAISSVAGERGRQSNYFYGAAKAGLNTYLQGLRNRLFRSGVRVITIKPGFVDTAMTFGRAGMFLVASPERAAEGIARAIETRRDVAYVPFFWRPLMFAIRSVPERLFKRLRL